MGPAVSTLAARPTKRSAAGHSLAGPCAPAPPLSLAPARAALSKLGAWKSQPSATPQQPDRDNMAQIVGDRLQLIGAARHRLSGVLVRHGIARRAFERRSI